MESEGLALSNSAQPNPNDTNVQLSKVVERVSDAVIALNKNWVFTYLNQQAGALFKRRAEELVGKFIWEELPEDIAKLFRNFFEKAFSEQTFLQFESYIESRHSWLEVRVFPSPDGLSIFLHDITEQKLQAQAADESASLLEGQNQILELIAQGTPLQTTLEALIRVIEAQSPDMLGSILLLDRDGVHLRHGAAPSLPESYTQKLDGEPIGPRAGSCGTAAYRHDPVIVEDIATDPLWTDYREIALKHDLRACWSIPIFDEQRNVLGTFALYFHKPGLPTARHYGQIAMATHTAAIAITRHNRIEALLSSRVKLQLRETQLSEAQRIAKFGSYQWIPGSDEVSRSEELCEIFGLRREDFPPTFEGYLERIHPEDRPNTKRIVEQALREQKPFETEERIILPDGSTRILLSIGRWVFDEARQVVKLIGICQDISESRKTEHAKAKLEEQLWQVQKMDSIGKLASGIAHDFNNILSVIVGYGELARQTLPDDSPARRHLSEIHKTAQRAAVLTRRLLAFGRQQVLQPTVLNLNIVIDNVGKIINRLIGEHISLHVTTDMRLGRAKADLAQVEQVLMNLVVNARDAMPKGGKIFIETANVELDENYSQWHPRVPPGSYIMLAVTDTGCGMTEETMSHIYEPFFTTKAVGEGTGLGLSVVYGVVKQSEAHIIVNSRVGKGTTFKIYFPRIDQPVELEPPSTTLAVLPRGSETVLVVEDDEALRDLITILLTNDGYKVLNAKDATIALEIAAEFHSHIDLVLTDLVMPDISGGELTARIKASHAEMHVLYMSGYPNDFLSHYGEMNPEIELLQKPFTSHDLLAHVRAALQKKVS
jgi:PAS domain S-box-containing protein